MAVLDKTGLTYLWSKIGSLFARKADLTNGTIVPAQAAKLQTARTISLAGDVSGSANFDGSANVSITATVADDSHNHVIGNVDGLQSALDGKSGTNHYHPINKIYANLSYDQTYTLPSMTVGTTYYVYIDANDADNASTFKLPAGGTYYCFLMNGSFSWGNLNYIQIAGTKSGGATLFTNYYLSGIIIRIS